LQEHDSHPDQSEPLGHKDRSVPATHHCLRVCVVVSHTSNNSHAMTKCVSSPDELAIEKRHAEFVHRSWAGSLQSDPRGDGRRSAGRRRSVDLLPRARRDFREMPSPCQPLMNLSYQSSVSSSDWRSSLTIPRFRFATIWAASGSSSSSAIRSSSSSRASETSS
jgi:hypothetical protein